MFLKKLLATVASVALTGGALLGVSTPAFADDVAPPAHSSDTSLSLSDSGIPTPESTPSELGNEAPAPVAAKPVSSVVVPDLTPTAAAAALAAQAVAPVEEERTPAVEAASTAIVEAAPSETQSRKKDDKDKDKDNDKGNGNGNDHGDKKVWVCKFVSSANSPSGYALKKGEQPIEVSANSVGNDVSATDDFDAARAFNDRQPSFVVAENDVNLCSRSVTTVDEDVVCSPHKHGGTVNVTTTTTFYYGATQAGVTITHSTRDLTAGEHDKCDPPKKVFVCEFEPSKKHSTGWVLAHGDQPVLTWLSELSDDIRNADGFTVEQPSFIVASNDRALCASSTVERSTQVMCPTAMVDGYATMTTLRTYFYGTVPVGERTTVKVRDLTEGEQSSCPPIELAQATAEVALSTAGCSAPQQLILGPIANATWGEVTDPEGPLDYSVTATADAGAEFASGPELRVSTGVTTLTFAGTLDPQLDPADPECDLVTLGLLMPAVTFSQASCTAAGSYTLGTAAGYDPALVTFTVDGVAGMVAGTYPVANSGAVAVSAQAVAPNGLEFDWVDPAAFTFAVPSDDDCGSALPTLALRLPTLAFTGGGGVGPLWWLLSTSMILLGAAAIYVRRRMDAVS
ncbi:hypothetical protein [Salinibacterium sp. PAMC 21357]|uniref:hypothetical protein n=1 Tax=Salinibacterium sp. PAMC 21357 TaxID=1112215 RepID=UPI00028A1393|nr:hypothetical protein [Salinibacterium sp. PAMC 21357]